jgi:hypothetical protein
MVSAVVTGMSRSPTSIAPLRSRRLQPHRPDFAAGRSRSARSPGSPASSW